LASLSFLQKLIKVFNIPIWLCEFSPSVCADSKQTCEPPTSPSIASVTFFYQLKEQENSSLVNVGVTARKNYFINPEKLFVLNCQSRVCVGKLKNCLRFKWFFRIRRTVGVFATRKTKEMAE